MRASSALRRFFSVGSSHSVKRSANSKKRLVSICFDSSPEPLPDGPPFNGKRLLRRCSAAGGLCGRALGGLRR